MKVSAACITAGVSLIPAVASAHGGESGGGMASTLLHWTESTILIGGLLILAYRLYLAKERDTAKKAGVQEKD